MRRRAVEGDLAQGAVGRVDQADQPLNEFLERGDLHEGSLYRIMLLGVLSAWDQQLLVFINVHLHHPWGMTVMAVLTELGHYWIVLPAGAAAGIVRWRQAASGPPETRRQIRRDVLAGWAGVLAALFLSGFLKRLVRRPRPLSLVPGLFVAPSTIIGSSYPSGHTTGAFALATALSVWWPQRWWVWWSLAAVVAFSRMYLGLHYPSDCIGGALVGSLAVAVAMRGARWWMARAR